MHRVRAAILIVSAALIAVVAVVAVMNASGTSDTQPAVAAGPTATPITKPGTDGALSGLRDVQIPAYVAGNAEGGGTCGDTLDNDGDTAADSEDPDCHDTTAALYHCITRQDHDGTTNQVKANSMCYAEVDLDPAAAVSAIPELPGEEPDGLWREPPPPPYTGGLGGNKGYTVGGPFATDLTLTSCFRTDGRQGNIIAVTTFPNVLGQQAANGGAAGGTMLLYTSETDKACQSLTPVGAAGIPVPIQSRVITPSTRDYDGDGCSDMAELDKPIPDGKCGDDPYNPYDSSSDISGIYSLTAEALESDGAGDVPGAYYSCTADIEQIGSDVDARLLCYIDIAGTAVSGAQSNSSGDGYSGLLPANAIDAVGDPEASEATPSECQNGIDDDADTVVDDGCPAIFAGVGTTHTVLSGSISGSNTLDVEGCFKDEDGTGSLGNVYVRSQNLDVHTLIGEVEIWVLVNPGQPDCGAGPFTPGTGLPAELTGVRQDNDRSRDNDGDNCPTKNELSDNQQEGGLRDPTNRWDYMNPTGDGQNRVDDILATVNQYFIDAGSPGYTTHTDRTSLVGSNAWNLGPPNGQQRVDDILASVKSYFHDCTGGTFVDPDDEL